MALSVPRALTAANTTASGNASSIVIDADDPALVQGDERFVCISVTSGVTVNSIPSGWATRMDDNIAPDATRRIYVFQHTHNDADVDFTFGFSGASNYGMGQLAVGGAVAGGVQDGPTRNTADPGTSSITAPDRESFDPDTILIYFGMVATNSASATLSLPAGMTNLGTRAGTGSAGNLVRLAYENRPTAGLTGTRTGTTSVVARNAALSFIIAPAPPEIVLPPRRSGRRASMKR